MNFKKNFYKLEKIFDHKQYSTLIEECITIFENELKQIIIKYIDTVQNLNDKKKIFSIIETVGKNNKTLEYFNFEKLIELEEKLNIFFNLKKEDKNFNKRVEIFNFKKLINLYKKTINNKSVVQKIDAEIFLLSLKVFLTDFNLMDPLFIPMILCENCGNNVPSTKSLCPFCEADLIVKYTGKEPDIPIIKNDRPTAQNENTEQFVSRIRDRIETIKKNKKGYWEAVFFNKSEMIYIPEESFIMGSRSEGSFIKERPAHMVTISSFWISKYEITYEQYEVFCLSTGIQIPYDEKWGKAHRPVINISWHDANSYCEWLSAKTSLSFRLPTEAEWELAAKGKTNSIYPWGDSPPTETHANYNFNIGKTEEVGKYSAGISPYGLLDMSGNIREWCSDWYDEHFYKISPDKNPIGPIEGERKIIRGGGWGYDQSFLRTTDRNRWLPDDFSNEIGFRIVLEAD